MRLLFAILFLAAVSNLSAQTVAKAKDYLKANKLTDARTEIVAVMKDPAAQKNADAWYTQAKILGAIALDPILSDQFPNARMEAFTSLKKYTETDDKMLIALQIDGYKPVNDIYTGFYGEGANSFNAKDYPKALKGFKNAIEVSSFMNSKGWITMKLDTNSVLYAGVAAEKLEQFDDAANYYGMLAKAKTKGDGFVEIYKWVANHYYEKKDLSKAKEYVAIGKQVYPGDPFWASLELDMIRETGTKDELFAMYDKVIQSEPGNHLYYYNYAVELYQVGYNLDESKRPANSATLIAKAERSIGEAIRVKPAYSRAQLFAGQIRYNKGVDILNKTKEIKGTTPADLQKVSDIKASALKHFEEALPYFQATENILAKQSTRTEADKADLKEAYDLMITIYSQKKDNGKVKEYEAKFNAVKQVTGD